MLLVENVDLHYGAAIALRQVSLTAEVGAVTCLLGRNGVGKTTTLKLLMGLIFPTSGTARVLSQSIENVGMHREIGFKKTDASILEAASGAGLDMPFSCKSGVCCTCRAKLLRGEVRMERNFALDKAEIDAGFVLTCQAYPVTEEVVLSFDER